MARTFRLSAAIALTAAGVWGCASNPDDLDDASRLPAVSTKATQVAEQIGGPSGFGGADMEGYLAHGPTMMGFVDFTDLASSNALMYVHCVNDTGEDATFHMTFFASHMGLADQFEDIDVAAGSAVDVQLPCAEIVGFGSLDTPGAVGCHLASGDEVDNRFAVPGFLNLDFACGDTYECTLTADVDDLDGDGDTTEMILITDGMETHTEDGGPTGHRHGMGMGMMGSHMGF
jgi:hypothetical protein